MMLSTAQPRTNKIKEPQTSILDKETRPLVSIIVAGRNSAKYLYEAISSAFNQTTPCEVIYSDDCSTDESLDIANSFVDLIVIRHPIHVGVCAARNAGAGVARGKFLIFLDTDDKLTPNYVHEMLSVWSPEVPFVYAAAKAFGPGKYSGTHWQPCEFDNWDRWGHNTINTSTFYLKTVFDACGKWVDAPTLWDWDLALRAIRFGKPVTSKAILMYRQHEDSWSTALLEKDGVRQELPTLIRRRNARLTVGTIVSGRLPDLFSKWLERIALSVRFATLTQPVELIILVDNMKMFEQISIEVCKWKNIFSTIIIKPIQTEIELINGDCISRFLAAAMTQMREMSTGDVLWVVEDDILVPLTACTDLWTQLTDGIKPIEAIGGVYRNRHVPELLIGGWLIDGKYVEPTKLSEIKSEIDFTGCGCLMTWLNRPTIPKTWRSHVDDKIPAHDWAYCLDIKQLGGKVVWATNVLCGHVQSNNEIVWP